jgi:hypothetical protein
MAKRMTKAESTLIAAAVVIGVPIYGVAKLFEAVGWVIPTLTVGAVIAFFVWQRHHKKQKRLSYLREKYRDENLAQKIFGGYFWQGQTEEQLRDSLGEPVEIDNKLLKTKTKEIWKYHRQGANRFRLRITIEDGLVSGWDKKA